MHKLLLVIAVGLTLSMIACENKKDEGILPKVDATAQAEGANQSSSERDTFVKQVQQEIDKQAAELAGIRKRAAAATGKAKENLDQQIKRIEQEQKVLEEKLAALKASIGEKWKELKADVNAAVDKFRQSVKNAM